MLTQSEVWQGKVEAHQARLSHLEQRVTSLEEYNLNRDTPKPAGIMDDLARLCKGFNTDPKALLSKREDGFREKRKSICSQLAQRGWTIAQIAVLFSRDVRSIRRLCLKSAWDPKAPSGVRRKR